MTWRLCAALTVLSLSMPIAAEADPIPAPVEAMIRAAADSGDPVAFGATVDMAKKAVPNSAREIDALATRLQSAAEKRRHDELVRRGFFEGWKGTGQVGGSTSTGNTRSTAMSLALGFNRQGLQWDHNLNATVDYQRDNGIESKSRYFAGYQGNYKVSDDFYALGVLSWEDDRFSGFTNRFSEAAGMGYRIINRPDMLLSVEGGPALRQTNYIAGDNETSFAGRAAVNYDWTILPNLKFSEQASFYGESRDSTLTSNSALTVKLIGSLSAQLSYLVQYESSPPPLLENTNTTSRLTLVYNF